MYIHTYTLYIYIHIYIYLVQVIWLGNKSVIYIIAVAKHTTVSAKHAKIQEKECVAEQKVTQLLAQVKQLVTMKYSCMYIHSLCTASICSYENITLEKRQIIEELNNNIQSQQRSQQEQM